MKLWLLEIGINTTIFTLNMAGKNQIPPYLKAGDTVAIVSPSFAVDEAVIKNGVEVLEGWGLKVRVGKNVLKAHGPFAGTDEERLSDLQEFTSDPSVSAVFCSRGGYGIMRIIEKIDFSSLHKHPKWYVGFSDITALHIWLCEKINTASIHGEMLLNFRNAAKTPTTLASLRNALFGTWEPLVWKASPLRPAKASGEIIGGNLSIILGMCSSPASLKTKGKILFIEEVGEQLYHLDRMMVSLRMGGHLDGLAAIIAGGFSKMEDTKKPWGISPEAIITDASGRYGYPVFFNFPAGHISDNRAFYIGRRADISTDGETATLVYR
jgi:muramoyltetrapeptide carboxypeptidase